MSPAKKVAAKKTPATSEGKKRLKKVAKRPTFEQAFAELETVVEALESSQMGLSESLELYQKGVGCLKVCYGALEAAERKIELLTGVDEEGRAETEDFDDDDLDLTEKATGRSVRRGAKPGRKSGAEAGEGDEDSSVTEAVDDEGRLF